MLCKTEQKVQFPDTPGPQTTQPAPVSLPSQSGTRVHSLCESAFLVSYFVWVWINIVVFCRMASRPHRPSVLCLLLPPTPAPGTRLSHVFTVLPLPECRIARITWYAAFSECLDFGCFWVCTVRTKTALSITSRLSFCMTFGSILSLT